MASAEVFGPIDVIQEAFNFHLIDNVNLWLEMVQSRNLVMNSYDKKVAKKLILDIREQYHLEFLALEKTLNISGFR